MIKPNSYASSSWCSTTPSSMLFSFSNLKEASFPLYYFNPTVKHRTCELVFERFRWRFSATKVSIERRDKFSKDEFDHLERLHKQMLGPAINIFRTDKHARGKDDQSLRRWLRHGCVCFRVAHGCLSKKWTSAPGYRWSFLPSVRSQKWKYRSLHSILSTIDTRPTIFLRGTRKHQYSPSPFLRGLPWSTLF